MAWNIWNSQLLKSSKWECLKLRKNKHNNSKNKTLYCSLDGFVTLQQINCIYLIISCDINWIISKKEDTFPPELQT